MTLPLFLLGIIASVIEGEITEEAKKKVAEKAYVLTEKKVEQICTRQALGGSALAGGGVWLALRAGINIGQNIAGGAIVAAGGAAAAPVAIPLLLVNTITGGVLLASFTPMKNNCGKGLIKSATSVELNPVVKEVINRNPSDIVNLEDIGRWGRFTTGVCKNLRETPFWQGKIVQAPRKFISAIFDCDIL